MMTQETPLSLQADTLFASHWQHLDSFSETSGHRSHKQTFGKSGILTWVELRFNWVSIEQHYN